MKTNAAPETLAALRADLYAAAKAMNACSDHSPAKDGLVAAWRAAQQALRAATPPLVHTGPRFEWRHVGGDRLVRVA